MPWRRASLPTGSPASACFSMETICCSVNRLLRICPPFGGLTLYLDQLPGSRSILPPPVPHATVHLTIHQSAPFGEAYGSARPAPTQHLSFLTPHTETSPPSLPC